MGDIQDKITFTFVSIYLTWPQYLTPCSQLFAKNINHFGINLKTYIYSYSKTSENETTGFDSKDKKNKMVPYWPTESRRAKHF